MTLIVLTGMSGAGKTTGLHALEDAGFFCVDNLPPTLWTRMAQTARDAGKEAVALGIDVRGAAFLDAAPAALAELAADGFAPRVVYLDAREEALVRRFNFTRRTHPLGRGGLAEDLSAERAALAPLRSRADLVIDTTALTDRDLRTRMQRLAGDDRFVLRLLSFGYKRGVPTDVDAVLDVRGLRNPYYDPDLRPLPGTDPKVQAYVFESGLDAYVRLREVTRDLTQAARRSGRGAYTVAVGCTGGQHRSVAVVERLAHDLADTFAVEIGHRDLGSALAEHEHGAPDAGEGGDAPSTAGRTPSDGVAAASPAPADGRSGGGPEGDAG